MSRIARDTNELLLGEWACLGIIAEAPSHGFAVASRLRPDGDIGRIWSISRPLTYRAIDQLLVRNYIEAVSEEQGLAGGMRTVYRPTRTGRAALRTWLGIPVAHLRDLRSELLLKLALARHIGFDTIELVRNQRRAVGEIVDGLRKESTDDVVSLWRLESAEAAQRFLGRLER